MVDNNDKLEIEASGDLDKNNHSDLGSSSESVDLEIEGVNSPDAKKKDGKTLEIDLNTELPEDDITNAVASAVVLGNQVDEENATSNLPEPEVEIPPEIPTSKNEAGAITAEEPAKTSEKKMPENDLKIPANPTEQAQPKNQQPVASPPPNNASAEQPQQSQQPPKDEDPRQSQTTKTPPTISQQPQMEAPKAKESQQTQAQSQKTPQKSQETKPNQPTDRTPPSVAKEDLANIGPHGGLSEKKLPPHGQSGPANYLVDPNKKFTGSNKAPNANETLNSPQLTQPNNTKLPANENQRPSKVPVNQQSGVAENLEQQKALSWSETEKIQQENYDKLDERKKQNEAKQKKKLLKKLSKQNEKLIGPLEKMLLRSYFPFVTQKIIDTQDEIKKLIEKEQRAKTRSGHNKIARKISNLLRLVIEPTLKISSFRDAIRRFRNFWLSWSVELWWWTVIMAIFDLIIVFPIFLFINYIFAGRSTRMLEKIKKRSYDIMELGNKLNDITMKNIKERLKLSASSKQNK